MSTQKPLFVPLKTAFFEAFESGAKKWEYRKIGARWNWWTCKPGRQVVLSKGYGKKNRLTGVIIGRKVMADTSSIPGWSECYPGNSGPAIAFRIAKVSRLKSAS